MDEEKFWMGQTFTLMKRLFEGNEFTIDEHTLIAGENFEIGFKMERFRNGVKMDDQCVENLPFSELFKMVKKHKIIIVPK